MDIFITILLLAISVCSVGLLRVYYDIPTKELRRRARKHEPFAEGLYRAVSYGVSLRVILLAIALAANAGLYLFVARTFAVWVALFFILTVLWFVYIWLPGQKVRAWMVAIAARVSPILSAILQYIHPIIDRIASFIRRHRPVHVHTGMYELEDFVETLKAQAEQPDNRIPEDRLRIALHAMTFYDVPIHSVMTPRREVMAVSIEEKIGPVLLTELHDSGFSRFPVYEDKEDNIVGVLFLRDLVDVKNGGTVKEHMKARVCYINEDNMLDHALQAFIKTNQHLFMVVNSFEEFVGVVSVEDIIEAIIGSPIVDEFDAFDDLRAVAAKKAKLEKRTHEHPVDKEPKKVDK